MLIIFGNYNTYKRRNKVDSREILNKYAINIYYRLFHLINFKI